MYYDAFLGPNAKPDAATADEKQELRMAIVRFFATSLKCVNIYGQLSNNPEVHNILVQTFNKFVEDTKEQLGHLHKFKASTSLTSSQQSDE